MPVFRSGKSKAPGWCELEDFNILELVAGETRALARAGRREEIIVCRGAVAASTGKATAFLPEGGKLDLNFAALAGYRLTGLAEKSQLFRAVGRWRSICSSGVFTAQTATPPNFDTPYTYQKTTSFDNHYHDCDEYWIVLEGTATVASEGKLFEVGPGDCVATGLGWHHDVLSVGQGPFRAVWFEGTLEGRKRVGHLWEPKHGKARPKTDRA